MFVACETSIGKVGLPLQVIFSVTYDLFMAGTLKLGHQVSGIGCATVRGRQVLPKPNMSLGWELGTRNSTALCQWIDISILCLTFVCAALVTWELGHMKAA